MSIQCLRHRLSVYLRIPLGFLAAVSLMVLLAVGAMPVIEVHAHADPGADHGTAADHHGMAGHHDQDDSQQRAADASALAGEAPGDAIWHVHDACSSASTLVETPQLALGARPPAAHLTAAMALPAVSARPGSLLRPPIG